MVRTVLVALSVASVVLTIAACGSSSKTQSDTSASGAVGSTGTSTSASPTVAREPTGSLTRAELIAQGNTICSGAKKFNSSKVTSTDELVRKLREEAAFNRMQATELEKLVPPASMTDDWKTIVAGVRTLADNTTQVAEYADSHNSSAGAIVLVATRKLRAKLSTNAQRNGFT
jgi:hypothetical protein